MKKLSLFLLVFTILFLIPACKSEPVWSRIEEHDLEPTSDKAEMIDQSLFENQIPPDSYSHDYYSFENNNDSESLARTNDDNLSNKDESVENDNKSQNENKTDTNIDSEKITGYLRDILAAITTPENENVAPTLDESEYIPPEQFPPIEDPIFHDESAVGSSNEIDNKDGTSSDLQRPSYVQDAWPRPGTAAWLAAQSGTNQKDDDAQGENSDNETEAKSETEHDVLYEKLDETQPLDDEQERLEIPAQITTTEDDVSDSQIAAATQEDTQTTTSDESESVQPDTTQQTDVISQTPAQLQEPVSEEQILPNAQTQQIATSPITQQTTTQTEQPVNTTQTQTTTQMQQPAQTQQSAGTAKTPIQTQSTAQTQAPTQAQQAVTQAQVSPTQSSATSAQPTNPVQAVPSQSSTASAQRGQTQQTPVTTPQTPAQQTSPVRQNQQTQTAQQRPTVPSQQNVQQSLPSVPATSQQVSPTTSQMSYQHIPETEIAQVETAEEIARTTSPSRSVTLDLGAYLDVNYPGSGWIYLGESEGSNCLQFFGRKLGETDTAFTLRAKTPGTALLHFYKNDLLTGKYIDDWLEVTVTDKQVANSSIHVTAPSYAAVIPPRPTRSQTNETQTYVAREQQTPAPSQTQRQNAVQQPAANTASQEKPSESVGGRTVIQTTTNTSQAENTQRQNQPEIPQPQNTPTEAQTEPQAIASIPSDTNALLDRAKQLYNSGNHADALNILHQFFDMAKDKIDEGLFLQGQILESNSSVRDIRAAIDSYQILINNWPDSALWQDAQRRYIYLRRFYINIH